MHSLTFLQRMMHSMTAINQPTNRTFLYPFRRRCCWLLAKVIISSNFPIHSFAVALDRPATQQIQLQKFFFFVHTTFVIVPLGSFIPTTWFSHSQFCPPISHVVSEELKKTNFLFQNKTILLSIHTSPHTATSFLLRIISVFVVFLHFAVPSKSRLHVFRPINFQTIPSNCQPTEAHKQQHYQLQRRRQWRMGNELGGICWLGNGIGGNRRRWGNGNKSRCTCFCLPSAPKIFQDGSSYLIGFVRHHPIWSFPCHSRSVDVAFQWQPTVNEWMGRSVGHQQNNDNNTSPTGSTQKTELNSRMDGLTTTDCHPPPLPRFLSPVFLSP